MAAVRLIAVTALALAAAVGWGAKRTVTACPAHPASLPDHYGVLRGDVDGDGRADRVSVKVARSAPKGCQFFLVALRAQGDLVRQLPNVYEPQLYWPQVAVLAPIDDRPGAEIVVILDHGASAAFAGVFVVRQSTLRQLRIGGRQRTFHFYGSVGFGGAVDCVGKGAGQVLQSSYGHEQEGNRYGIDRTFLDLRGTVFRIARTETFRRKPYGWWERFPEFASPQPFPSCAMARNSQAR